MSAPNADSVGPLRRVVRRDAGRGDGFGDVTLRLVREKRRPFVVTSMNSVTWMQPPVGP